MEIDNIIIKRAILHVLDVNAGRPELSDQDIEMGSNLHEFIKKHIGRLLKSDSTKSCVFHDTNSDIYRHTAGMNVNNFVHDTQFLAEKLYSLMTNGDIPSADLLCVLFCESGMNYLAILKMDYKQLYSHHIDTVEGQKSEVQIVLHKDLLPSPTTRLSEAALITLGKKTAAVIEKKREINGEKKFYFSEQFLECYAFSSTKDRLNTVAKSIEFLNQKYYGPDGAIRSLEVKTQINSMLEEYGEIDVEKLANAIFDGEESYIKEDFLEKMEKRNLTKRPIKPSEDKTYNRFSTQHVKTDSGINIMIPMDTYNDSNLVQFITNEDGTISILLKNVNIVRSKL